MLIDLEGVVCVCSLLVDLGFSKRSVSNLRLYHDFVEQLKRGMMKQSKQKMRNQNADEDLAVYDVKNGIYFWAGDPSFLMNLKTEQF